MYLHQAVVLAALFAEPSAAFVPSCRAPRAHPSFVHTDASVDTSAPPDVAVPNAIAPPEQPPAVFPGVKLPDGKVPKAITYPSVEEKVGEFLGTAIPTFAQQIINQPKTSNFEVAQAALVASQELARKLPNPEEYKFFGNGDHAGNLLRFVKTNPFMATALTEKKGGFEIRSFDPQDPHCANSSSTVYRKIMSALDGTGHRVNVRFNSDLSKIKKIKVYDDISGQLLKEIGPEDKEGLAYWSTSAMYNMVYYASCVHATIHVLHFLMTAALDVSSEGFDALNQWAKVYATHIPAKYTQVGQLLIRGQPSIFAVLGTQPGEIPASFFDTYALVTGTAGFGASGAKLVPILQEMLNTWGKDPSKFVGTMTLPVEKMKKAGILTEFTKHYELVAPFASEVSDAVRSILGERKYARAENRTKRVLKRCGFESNIDTLEQWIQLMAVTGIVHGSTLSYSRLFGEADILRWRDIQSDVWEAPDIALSLKGLATICGMDDHRHVFTSSTDTPGETYAAELQAVLDKYDGMTSELKEAYKSKIMQDTKEFQDYGWILSDYAPDGFDGKQLTIATYI